MHGLISEMIFTSLGEKKKHATTFDVAANTPVFWQTANIKGNGFILQW